MPTTAKKQVSKFFRVGLEGATSDGRTIERDWLLQMAKSYDPKVYGARINLEHVRGYSPNGDFKAYGDVIALKTEEVEIGGQKKLALLAQISPTDELIAITKNRQKIYTSMEVRPKFADTDRAYLTGLAVTDNPASLGTEQLEFAAKATTNPFAARKDQKDDLFTVAELAELEFEDAPEDTASIAAKFADTVKGLRAMFTGRAKTEDDKIDAIVDTIGDIGTAFASHDEALDKANATITAQGKTITELSAKVKDLEDKFNVIDNTPAGNQRPPASGGSGVVLTEF